LELLLQYDWPGNIRELEHEIERALTLAGEGEDIIPAYLSERIQGNGNHNGLDGEMSTSLPAAVVRLERRLVINALKQTGGNRSRAAALLGLTRQGLLNKIARYHIKM
jgi:transcriptional regulator with PAS, ATPase and Fis domain